MDPNWKGREICHYVDFASTIYDFLKFQRKRKNEKKFKNSTKLRNKKIGAFRVFFCCCVDNLVELWQLLHCCFHLADDDGVHPSGSLSTLQLLGHHQAGLPHKVVNKEQIVIKTTVRSSCLQKNMGWGLA